MRQDRQMRREHDPDTALRFSDGARSLGAGSPPNLYLAYHEGRGGYRRGTWKEKPKLQQIATRVAETASRYEAQLKRCESEFRCDSWWEVWPLCS